jgi:hypothetical protein
MYCFDTGEFVLAAHHITHTAAHRRMTPVN